jgi:hypothetical protein
MSALSEHIQSTRLVDTHEHMGGERSYLEGGDILCDLFDNYITADLVVAGASPEAVEQLTDASNPDIAGRFAAVRPAWERCLHTGYGEAVRLIGQLIYGMDEISGDAILAAAPRTAELRRPGERLRLLRDVANLDHIQVDNFNWLCPPDRSGPDFFLYDLSWVGFAQGEIDVAAIQAETGIAVESIADLRQAIEAIFARHAPTAIAVKTQHAYNRTLHWQERDDSQAEHVLQRILAGQQVEADELLCIGDWALARGVEQAIAHHLPFKIHTGYYAGYGRMPVERIQSGLLTPLLRRFPDARFVLMHLAYPYSGELIALAKHYPNVYIDMCWSWSIDPYSSCDALRRAIHAVPDTKVFAFGGDTFLPAAAVAYAAQARTWLTRALQAEVDQGLLSERDAIGLATRLMRDNQLACFDVGGRRQTIAAQLVS